METFYNVVLIRRQASDGAFIYSGDNFTDKDAAKKRWHTLLGSYYDNSTYDYVACYIVRSDGVVTDGDFVHISAGE